MRMQIPLAVCFVMGAVMLAQYFVPHAWSQELNRRVYDWMLLIGVFALVLGVASLVKLHWQRAARREGDWKYSVVALAALFGMTAVGIVEGHRQPARQIVKSKITEYSAEASFERNDLVVMLSAENIAAKSFLKGDRLRLPKGDGSFSEGKIVEKPTDALSDALSDAPSDAQPVVRVQVDKWRNGDPPVQGGGFTVRRPGLDVFMWLFENVQVPLDATMFSLLAFFIASAAFRAFRARNIEAALLLISACVVILGLTPPFVGLWNWAFASAEWLQNFPSAAKDWVLETPNLAARRAIVLGVGLGALAQSFRIILGIEQTYLGGDE